MSNSKRAGRGTRTRKFEVPGLVVVPAAAGVGDLISVLPNRSNLWDKSNDVRIGLRLSRAQLDEIEAHSIGSLNTTVACLLEYAVDQLLKNRQQLQVSRQVAPKKAPAKKKA